VDTSILCSYAAFKMTSPDAYELRMAQRLRQLIAQHWAAVKLDIPGNGRFQQPPRRPVPQQARDDDVRIEHQPQRQAA
jgi:hypothetical protein